MNSWILEDKKENNLYHCFCKCSYEFQIKLSTDEDFDELICPKCNNDYFIDSTEFIQGDKTKIWKQFFYKTSAQSDKNKWIVKIYCDIPMYLNFDHIVKQKIYITQIYIPKTATKPDTSYKIKKINPAITRYKLYQDGKIKELSILFAIDLKPLLLDEILENKTSSIQWIDSKSIEDFTIEKKLKYISFFIKNHHLKEKEFFYWNISEDMFEQTKKYTTQKKMLSFIANHREEKSIKKALYLSYIKFIKNQEYYPYSSFMFSRCFNDVNLLVKLLSIDNSTQKELVNAENLDISMKLIQFLKTFYNEKQISRLFIEQMQKYPHSSLRFWSDTVGMLQTAEDLIYIQQHFVKVKLTLRNLHDKFVEIFNLKRYEDNYKSVFTYTDQELRAQTTVNDLEFRLPENSGQLYQWARYLHNCMFSYKSKIQNKLSTIYGVFRDDTLLYAIEIQNNKIVQAYGKYNSDIKDDKDTDSILKWYRL